MTSKYGCEPVTGSEEEILWIDWVMVVPLHLCMAIRCLEGGGGALHDQNLNLYH